MSTHTAQTDGSQQTAWDRLTTDFNFAVATGVSLKPQLADVIDKFGVFPEPIRAGTFAVYDPFNNDLMNFTAIGVAAAAPANNVGIVGASFSGIGAFNDGEANLGVGGMAAFNTAGRTALKKGPIAAVLVNVVPTLSNEPLENELAVNVGIIFNVSELAEKGLDKLGPFKFIGGLASMGAKLITNAVDVWVGVAVLTKARFDDDGKFIGLIKDGEIYNGFNNFIAETTALLDTFNDDDFVDNDGPLISPAIQANIITRLEIESVPIRANEPFKHKVDIPTGAVTFSNNSTFYEGIDGTTVTTWNDGDGDNIAITYGDGTVYIESSDGLRTLYDANGDVVRQSSLQVEQDGSGYFEKFDEFLEVLESGDVSAQLPSFAINFSFPDETLAQLFFPDAEGVEFVTVMTSSGLARIVSLDGVQYIVYADGRHEKFSDLIGEDGKLADGVTLEQVLAGSEVLFEVARKEQAEKSPLQTWESQYKKPVDAIVAQLNDPKNAALYDTFSELRTLVDGYGVVDGAVRFSLNLASLMADKKGTDGSVSGAVDGLITLLHAAGNLANEEADILKSAAFSIEMVAKAHRAFSSDNKLDARLGFANDSIMAMGALATLGVVDG
ncbi:hypothetical protein MNBD_ALPHA08-2012, partial [hydrothermal vent metagenome]